VKNPRSLVLAFSLLLILGLIVAPPVVAQTGNGTIQGTVKDPTGALVPSAKVLLIHTDTGREYESSSNSAGFFTVPSVLRGNYKVKVSLAGMEVWQAELLVQTGQTVLIEPVLKVGSTSTEVTVLGNVTPLVTAESGTVASTLERARIEQLPLNGRFIQGLVATTVPGIEGSQSQPRVNGLRATSMEFLQDGAVLTNRDTGDLAARPPGLDSVEEFRVETNGSSAKLNRPATTIIQTRSGTNALHGAVFETARNNGIGVARAREDFYPDGKPPHLVRNEFGASLGGPVVLPKIYNGKNRSFFFFSWESYRNMESSTTSIDMPTMAMRQGDFSGLVDGSGRATTLYDPWSTQSADNNWQRTPYPGNKIPLSQQSPLAKYLYNITPEPTRPDVNPLVSANYYGQGPNNRRDWTITTRFDQRLGDKDQLFVRFSDGKRWSGVRAGNGSPVTLNQEANITFNPVKDTSGVISWTHTFSPTFFSETLFNGSNEFWQIYSGKDLNWADQLGLPNPFHATGWPQLTGMGFGMDYETENRRENTTRIFNLDENLVKVAGKHEFQFGGRFRHERLYILPDQQQMQGGHIPQGGGTGLFDPTSGSDYSAVPLTGSDAANLFIGNFGYYSNQFVRGWYYMNAREYALYFQDNFKVTPRLTLNLGVRWEFYPNVKENNNVLTGFDLANHAVVNSAPLETMYKAGASLPSIVKVYQDIGVRFVTPQDAGLPKDLIYSNPHDFGPRAAFAYKLGSGKRAFVVRGGYSLFGFPIPLRTFDARMRSNPPTSARFIYDTGDAAQAPDGLPNYGLRSAPYYVAGLNSTDLIDPNNAGGVGRGSFRTSFFDPHQPTSRAHEWNFSIERELDANTVAKVQYVGNHGANLDQFYEYNEQPPAYIWYTRTGLPIPGDTYAQTAQRPYDQTVYGTVEEYKKTGWSNYQGVQLELRRQYGKGIAFQLFYVISNAMVAGGNGWSSDLVNQPNYYLPGTVPTDTHELIRLLYYRRDSSIPKHRVRWNWLVDLPVGRGQKLLSNTHPILNHLVGGWQLAGFGSLTSSYTTLSTSFWGPTGKVEVYGKKYPIQDCRGGACIPGYLWFNGYIPANRINSYDENGQPNGVMGVPDNYQPALNYIINAPKTPDQSDPLYRYYDTNTVWVTMKDGSQQRTTFNNGLNPMQNQYIQGPFRWGLDASLFKSIRINERFNCRFNADFFNVLNMPGLPGPSGSSGILSLQNSANTPRRLQLTLRLQF
jgi:hypothetical protein